MSGAQDMSPAKCGFYGYLNNSGSPCGGNVIAGTTTCRRHAGKSTEVAKAEGQVKLAVMRWTEDTAPRQDPDELLLRMIAVTAALRNGYAAHLQAAYDDAPMDRKIATLVGVSYGDGGPTGEYIRGLVQLEALERTRCVDWSIKAKTAGIEERRVQLAEQLGGHVVAVLRLAAVKLGLELSAVMVQNAVAEAMQQLTVT